MDAEEKKLWQGRPETRNALYDLYRHEIDKIVEATIHRMGLPVSVDYDALVSAGHVGALQAIAKFDLCKGLTFGTFAQWRIRGAIIDELRHSDIKRSVRSIVTQRLQAERDLHEQLQREPTQDEVCELLGWDARQYLLSTRRGQSSIDTVLNRKSGYERPVTLKDRVYVPQGRDLESTFREITRGLNIQEQTILYLYYWCGTTMKLTGQAMGLSESRVSQMHTQLMAKLKTTAGERFVDALRA